MAETPVKIVLLGATGHTGKLALRALLDRDVDVRACGRNGDALAALRAEHPGVEARRVDARDPRGVEAALEGADAVANLAGPFLETGHAPVAAAIRRGIPYVDTTGEQAFMREVRERHDAAARAGGTVVVNALAYEYAFADLAARACFPEGGDELHVLYRNKGAAASAGTKKSIVRVLAAPALGYEDGRLVPAPPGRFARAFETDAGPRDAMSIPGGEVLTVPRHTPFRTVRTYFVARPSTRTTSRLMRPIARLALRGPVLSLVERRIERTHRAPRNEAATGEIRLVAERDGATREVVVRTPDPYVATAEAAAEGIVRLARAAREGRRGGVLAPAEAFDATDFLAAMQRRMPTFRIESPFRCRGLRRPFVRRGRNL